MNRCFGPGPSSVLRFRFVPRLSLATCQMIIYITFRRPVKLPDLSFDRFFSQYINSIIGLTVQCAAFLIHVIYLCYTLKTHIYQELNERERAEHATRKYDQIQSLVKQLDERNIELEQKFAEVCFAFVNKEILLIWKDYRS